MKHINKIAILLALILFLQICMTSCANVEANNQDENESTENVDDNPSGGDSGCIEAYGPTIRVRGSTDCVAVYGQIIFEDYTMFLKETASEEMLAEVGDVDNSERLVFASLEEMYDRIVNNKLTNREKWILVNNGYLSNRKIERTIVNCNSVVNFQVGTLYTTIPTYESTPISMDSITYYGVCYGAEIKVDDYSNVIKYYSSFLCAGERDPYSQELVLEEFNTLVGNDMGYIWYHLDSYGSGNTSNPDYDENDPSSPGYIFVDPWGGVDRSEELKDTAAEGRSPQITEYSEDGSKKVLYYYTSGLSKKAILECYDTQEAIDSGIPTTVYLCDKSGDLLYVIENPDERPSHDWLLKFGYEGFVIEYSETEEYCPEYEYYLW